MTKNEPTPEELHAIVNRGLILLLVTAGLTGVAYTLIAMAGANLISGEGVTAAQQGIYALAAAAAFIGVSKIIISQNGKKTKMSKRKPDLAQAKADSLKNFPQYALIPYDAELLEKDVKTIKKTGRFIGLAAAVSIGATVGGFVVFVYAALLMLNSQPGTAAIMAGFTLLAVGLVTLCVKWAVESVKATARAGARMYINDIDPEKALKK